MVESTNDLELAKVWANEFLAEQNVAKYYLSDANFVVAHRDESGFSFVIKGEPFYGQLFGSSAFLDPRCEEFAVESSCELQAVGFAPRGGGFEIWESTTQLNEFSADLLREHEEINYLIDNHAPDSSTRPGDDEEVFWGGIRNSEGELIACAGVVKWQSGFHVVVSVVTRSEDRGKGYGTQLMKGISAQAFSLGISQLGLGVRRGNTAAQKVYEKAGYKRIGVFTNYSRE